MEQEELKDLIFELTHLKDADGNDVPHFCFATDIITEAPDYTEEGVAKFAVENGYSVYKVFPGETMVGGLVILAEGCGITPLTDMYDEFYGEIPDMVLMKLDDDGNLIEADSEANDDELTEEQHIETLEDKIRHVMDDHNGSQIHLFEVEPKDGDNAFYMKDFDVEGSVDFSHVICYEVDEEERMAGKPVASFMITGGENGSGNWDDYLDDLRTVFNKLRDTTGYAPVLYELETDVADDVWTGFVFLYDQAEYDVQEALDKLTEAFENRDQDEPVIRDPNARAMWGRTRAQTFKPKKGKGSFTRYPRHKGKLDEVFVPIDDNELEGLLNVIKNEGFRIDSVKKYPIDDSINDAADIHIQICSLDTYPDNTAARARTREVIDKMDAYMDSLEGGELKYRMTYSFGYGGTASNGEDYSGRISAGIDLRAPWVNDEDLPVTTVQLGATNESKSNELKKRAAKHKKTDKKGARGWFVNPNAGNVELNVQHFNHVSSSASAGVSSEGTATASAGLGEERRPTFRYDSPNKVKGEDAESCYIVERHNYIQDKILRRKKNRDVIVDVSKFFKEHLNANKCVISAVNTDISTYKVLSEGLEESSEDYYVVSDGKNPRHSAVYSEDGKDSAIEDAKSRHGYWEVLHYVNGKPEKIWSSEMKEDIAPHAIGVDAEDSTRYKAYPRDAFLEKPKWGRYNSRNHPEFRPPMNSIVVYNKDTSKLPPAAREAANYFFSEHPSNRTCVLLPEKIWSYEMNEGIIHEKVEKHDTLNPKLWDEANHLKPEVREKILEIVKEFTDGLEEDEIKFKVNDIVLVGSNCSYNYNDKSDLDIHIRMDTKSLKCPDNLYPLLYSAYRSLFNNKMDIDFYGIPVELYIETDDTAQMSEEPLGEARAQSAVKSNGIYSVLNDEWIKEPVAEDIPELDQEAFDKEFVKWQERYDQIMKGEDVNMEHGSLEILEKIIERTHYAYIGPIYRFGRKMVDRVELHTFASSERQAYNNLLYQAADEIGYDRRKGVQLSIDRDLIFEYEPEEGEVPDIARCERCGRRLNDNGECPLCDLGDESVLEELSSDEDSKIEEIESFIEDIYDLRKTSIAKDGEYGVGNLVFKEIRNLGYLDNLKDLKNILKSRKFSLE